MISKMYKEEIEKIAGRKLTAMFCISCNNHFMTTIYIKSCPICHSGNIKKEVI